VGSERSRIQLIAAWPSTADPAFRRGFVVAVLGAGVLVALVAPVRLCLVATIFHVPCPGCGLTRAAFAMLHGDFARAFALHPLSIVLVPAVAAVLATQAVHYVRTGSAWPGALRSRALEGATAVAALLLVAVWIARLCGCFGGPVPV